MLSTLGSANVCRGAARPRGWRRIVCSAGTRLASRKLLFVWPICPSKPVSGHIVPELEAEPLEYAGSAPDDRDGSASPSGFDTECLVSLDSVSVSSGQTMDTMGTGGTSSSMPFLSDFEELERRYPVFLCSLLPDIFCSPNRL